GGWGGLLRPPGRLRDGAPVHPDVRAGSDAPSARALVRLASASPAGAFPGCVLARRQEPPLLEVSAPSLALSSRLVFGAPPPSGSSYLRSAAALRVEPPSGTRRRPV